MKKILLKTYGFWLPLCLFWLVGSALVYAKGYHESFLIFNRHYCDLGDFFFPHFTTLADGVLVSCIFAFIVIKKDKSLIFTMICALLLMAQIISFLKYRTFDTWNRPFIVLGSEAVHYVSLQTEHYKSFPSGHSAAAATMGVFFAFFAANYSRFKGFFIGLCTIALCYSRIYIGVHFLGDTVVGSAIGALIGLLCLTFLYPYVEKRFAAQTPKSNQNYERFLYVLTFLVLIFDIYRIAEEIYKLI
jgi:undecaprenyl-diphosphatase